jgi:hypothetical protein
MQNYIKDNVILWSTQTCVDEFTLSSAYTAKVEKSIIIIIIILLIYWFCYFNYKREDSLKIMSEYFTK